MGLPDAYPAMTFFLMAFVCAAYGLVGGLYPRLLWKKAVSTRFRLMVCFSGVFVAVTCVEMGMRSLPPETPLSVSAEEAQDPPQCSSNLRKWVTHMALADMYLVLAADLPERRVQVPYARIAHLVQSAREEYVKAASYVAPAIRDIWFRDSDGPVGVMHIAAGDMAREYESEMVPLYRKMLQDFENPEELRQMSVSEIAVSLSHIRAKLREMYLTALSVVVP
jgi:hypothetical protein